MDSNFESTFNKVLRDLSMTGLTDARTKRNLDLLRNRSIGSLRDLCALALKRNVKSEVRAAACRALSKFHTAAATATLIEILEQAGPPAAWEAAKSLVSSFQQRRGATRRLIQIIRSGKNSHNRAAAAYVLGLAGRIECVPLLTKILKSGDSPSVRSHAAEAIGNLRGIAAIRPLIAALRDRSHEVRAAAAFALGQIGDPTALPSLEMFAASERLRRRQDHRIEETVREAIASIKKTGRA
jgi:HEAT repeat protein